MTTASVRLAFAFVLTMGIGLALAEHEDSDAHAKATTRTITLDGNDIRPSTLTMDHGDVVSFVNYSTNPVQVTFTEPSDLEKKIRCGLVHGQEKGAPAAPWALFTFKDGKLVGNVPPGQFASVCSLEPGRYSFTTEIIGLRQRDPGSVLPTKGQIEVK
jgi:plastocyanin